MNPLLRTREVAKLLATTPRTVTRTAVENKIGTNLGGSAGFRFTEDEVAQLRDAMHVEAASA